MIYDCFTFFNEFDVLDIRLNELVHVVDKFVLVEADRTHSNKPKPLHYLENRARYAQFHDKIIHIVVRDMPNDNDPWVRENFQRNCIKRGLAFCQPSDTIIVSDVDEIPARAKVREAADSGAVCSLNQTLYYYRLNFLNGPWYGGTRVLPYSKLGAVGGPQRARFAQGSVIPDAGWHFSYIGGVDNIRLKLDSFAHQEFNNPDYTSVEHIQGSIDRRRSLFDPIGCPHTFTVAPLSTMPEYVIRNRASFAHLLWSGFHENWCSESQSSLLQEAIASTNGLVGLSIELGCWEGRSTVCLANACYPEPLIAVDTWKGSVDESPDHITVALAGQRDIAQAFADNVRSLTLGNVIPIRMDIKDFFARSDTRPIKFCHIDAAHDYPSVKRDIQATLALLVPGGVICGDDFLNANMSVDALQGGVERAVRECLPGFRSIDNFWWWRKPQA